MGFPSMDFFGKMTSIESIPIPISWFWAQWVWVWLFCLWALWWFLVYLNRKNNGLPLTKGFLPWWDELPIVFFSLFIHTNKKTWKTHRPGNSFEVRWPPRLGDEFRSRIFHHLMGRKTGPMFSTPFSSIQVARKSMARCCIPCRVVDHARISERYLHLWWPCFQLSTRTTRVMQGGPTSGLYMELLYPL